VGIVGGRPESGVRVDVERAREPAQAPWRYEGEAATPEAAHRVAVVVEAGGAVSVELPPEAPAGLAEKVRLIVRAAWKHAHDDGAPPPRRIVRWRAA
jgi:hypothetical protein